MQVAREMPAAAAKLYMLPSKVTVKLLALPSAE